MKVQQLFEEMVREIWSNPAVRQYLRTYYIPHGLPIHDWISSSTEKEIIRFVAAALSELYPNG